MRLVDGLRRFRKGSLTARRLVSALQQDADWRQERTSRGPESHFHAARRSVLAASHCAVLRLTHRLDANADVCQDHVTAHTEHD
jgi:hypothetical protein